MSNQSTISKEAEAFLEVKRSKFIGRSFKTAEPEIAHATLKRIRKEFRDATHNCWAYRIGVSGQYSRCSDDGEPQGTAGAPILDTLVKNNATNTLLVVTRYFGGIKLGTGGLARAYNETAKMVLDLSRLIQLRLVLEIEITVPYSVLASLENYLTRIKGEVVSQAYKENVVIFAVIPIEEEGNFRLFYNNLVNGRYVIVRRREKYL